MTDHKLRLSAIAFALVTSIAASAVFVPIEDWYRRLGGNWAPSEKCQADLAVLRKELGALAFAVSKDGIQCGWDSQKIEIDAVKLVALQKCQAARVGVDCKVIFEREANYDLSKDCRNKLDALYSQPTAMAFAADKTGICGLVADRDHINDAIAFAMAQCKAGGGHECKIVYSRDKTHQLSVMCRGLLKQLRNSSTKFALAVHETGDCSTFQVEDETKRQGTEQEALVDCNQRYGAGCQLYASE